MTHATVVGTTSWGTTLAILLARRGAPVTLTSFPDGVHYMRLIEATHRSRTEGRAVPLSEV